MLLGLLSLSFLLFAAVFVPRLTNAHFGDVEFTGWSGPVAEHVVRGERPYVDFVLPIPPGSFAILALVQRAMGRPLLLQELWLGAAIHLVLSWLAYAIARQVTTRLNAVLVSLCSLVSLVNMYKECAYDHTAQLAAWCSIAAGARALFAEDARSARRFWLLTGAFAALTLAFKQSTGVGILAGWGMAHVYLAVVERWSGGEAKRLLGPAAHFVGGAALGVGVGVALLLAMNGSLAGYVQSVLVDGPALKGGRDKIIGDMIRYVAIWPSFPPFLIFAFGLAFVGSKIAAGPEGFHVGSDLARRQEPISRRGTLLVALAIVISFAGAALLLGLRVVISPELASALDFLKYLPHFSLTFAVVFMLAHLRRVRTPGEHPWSADPDRAGHALNALLIAAMSCSFLHNTSAPEFRPFYDNNPIIPLGYAMLFIALDRVRMPMLKAAVVVVLLSTLFSSKLARASEALLPAKAGTHWAGMSVSERGRMLEDAADRVNELTAPDDTVLVLPEDVTFAKRIGRPRPALRGAIVFVDQYPLRLASADIAELTENPPKVVVLHPVDDHYWTQMYRIWNGDSGAERLTRHVLTELLPKLYTRDRSYGTLWYGRPSRLDIWVRKDPKEP
jgi:hypothetical protein